jgi:predicted RNA methylase
LVDLERDSSVLSVDVDTDALAIAKENVESVEMEEEIELRHAEIASEVSTADRSSSSVPVFTSATLDRKFDTVIMSTLDLCPFFCRSWRLTLVRGRPSVWIVDERDRHGFP